LQQFEAIIKSKPNQREYQAAKEHRDFVGKTENLLQSNREIEDKIAKIKLNIIDDESARKVVQENFS